MSERVRAGWVRSEEELYAKHSRIWQTLPSNLMGSQILRFQQPYTRNSTSRHSDLKHIPLRYAMPAERIIARL